MVGKIFLKQLNIEIIHFLWANLYTSNNTRSSFLTHTRGYHLALVLEVFGTYHLAPGGTRAWAHASPTPTTRRRPSPPSSSGATTGGSRSSVDTLFMIIITMPGLGLILSLTTSQLPYDSTDNKIRCRQVIIRLGLGCVADESTQCNINI